MPTYEYRCRKGHTFDVFQKMSDEPVATCPECGGSAERVLSGGAGFLFKGEGFYITDYRSEEYKKKARAESPGGGGEGKSSRERGTGSGEKGGASSGVKDRSDAPKKARSGDAAGGSGGGDAGT